MSRQNKVNPGMYTQRGRLSQDDAARELRKQSAIASPHTWQPVNNRRQRLGPAGDAARDTEQSADETMVETSPRVKTHPKSRVTRNMRPTKAAPASAKAKAAKTKTRRKSEGPLKGRPTSTRTTGSAKTSRAKTAKARTTAMKRKTTKPARKAAMARKAGGGAVRRRTTSRPKS